MSNEITLRKATLEDLKAIIEIYNNAIDVMKDHAIDQWDDRYPTEEILYNDILNNQMMIGEINHHIASIFVLNQEYDDDYEKGNWNYREASFNVVHRLCVNPSYQGKVSVDNDAIN